MGQLHIIEKVLVAGIPASAPCTMDVLIDGDRFAAIAPHVDLTYACVDERTDGYGKLLIPGLINAHHHSQDRFDKGRFSGMPLEIWMSLYNPPTHPRDWTPREIYLRTLLNGVEMLRGGITTVVDDIHFGARPSAEGVKAAFQAYADLGMRADVSVAWCDRPFHEAIPNLTSRLATISAPTPPMPSSLDQVLALWQECAEDWKGRVRFVFSPSAPQRCSLSFLKRTWELARRYERPVLVHVLETRIQALAAQKQFGMSMIEFMRRHDLLDELSVLAHGVWLEEMELDEIAECGARIIHNPACNLKLGSGIAPIGAMLARGIEVGLGTDNNNGNDLNSMFDAMRLSALISGVGHAREQAFVDASQAFTMATLGGARAIGMAGSIGSIEVGKQADFALLDLNSQAFLPLNDVINQLVFSEQGHSVCQVYVDGRKLLDGDRIVRIDENALVEELRASLPTIQAKISTSEAAAQVLRPALQAAYQDCLVDPLMQRYLVRSNAFDY